MSQFRASILLDSKALEVLDLLPRQFNLSEFVRKQLHKLEDKEYREKELAYITERIKHAQSS